MAGKLDRAHIRRDAKGNIRHVDHSEGSFRPKGRATTPSAISARYIREVLGLEDIVIPGGKKPSDAPVQLVCIAEKKVGNTTVCEFEQQLRGIPVWRSGVSVALNGETREVTSSTSTYDYDMGRPRVSKKKLEKHAETISRALLFDALALGKNLRRAKTLQPDINIDAMEVEITAAQTVVYCYDASKRQEEESKDENRRFLGDVPRLALPKVDERIRDGKHYVVTEVLFSISSPWGNLNWRVLIDPDSNSVLYLRALVAHMTAGLVFDDDPLTANGDATITPGSPTAALNDVRTPRPLPGLVASAPQALTGNYVTVQNVLDPAIAPPTVAAGNFDFDADTDDFSAVNAYLHSDAAFRMVEEMGFDMATYFDGTAFPVPVDHRGKCGNVNAKAPGNATGDGSDGFRYGLVDAGQPVGIATDRRIVLHEFGHAILWDNVHSPNFGFAHSCGDSLAALLGDPRSAAPDRFETFPWLTQSNPGIDRRHDRDVTGGWAWGGTNDDGGYGSEQILCTSHFRAYLSLGGGSADLCEREWASRYLVYLILCGVGVLTPTTNANSPEDWAAELIACDLNSIDFEGHPGGAVHKVIRWAFEKQGAFQAPGAPMPVVTEGAPPDIDIYINDGRNGEYQYTDDYCRTTEIWNRRVADGGAAHQKPVPGIPNYAYVIVRNRGTQGAEGVRVRGYHRVDCRCGGTCCCCTCKDMTWPNDFKPMRRHRRNVPFVPAGGYEIVGPFRWIPGKNDCMLMRVDTQGDRSNVGRLPVSATIPVRLFLPFDNNLAIRELCSLCKC